MKNSVAVIVVLASTSVANAQYAPCADNKVLNEQTETIRDGDKANASGKGKTRAQVVAELYVAREQGLAPSGRHDWPPTEQSIRRNKSGYEASQRWHEAHACQ
jgi:hypothetical protein